MREEYLPEKLNLSLRLLFAQSITSFFFIISLMSFSMSYSSSIRPEFFTMLIFYWAVYRPTFILPVFVFLFGLAIDITSGLPIGINACALVAMQWFVQRKRMFLMGRSFMGLWVGFSFSVTAVILFKWISISLIYFALLPAEPAIASIITSILFFPFAALLLFGVHKILPIND